MVRVLQAAADGGIVERLVEDATTAFPRVAGGVVFLVVAAVVITLALGLFRRALRRVVGDEELYVQFASTVLGVFLWFAAALTFLSIVGLEQIAAALGTASGFLALGVSYALSGMIADAVAGVYLLRDPDFDPGQRVKVGGTEGTVRSIELRKSRLEVEGDVLVRGNSTIEKEWTHVTGDEAASDAPAGAD
jgi:small-conductance mechanosensitive channel